MNALTLSATRRRKPLVILTGPALAAKFSTPAMVRLSRALSKAAAWAKCICTFARVVMALAAVSVIAAWGAAMYLELHYSAAARLILAASTLTGIAATFALAAMQEGGAQ